MKYAIVILTINPNIYIFKFLEKLKRPNYDLYISIDNNNYQLPNYNNNIINIIKYENDKPLKSGYCSTFYNEDNRVISRDKALFYFCEINKNYDYVWLIEDDVLIPNINTIYNIDVKYTEDDLLSKGNIKASNEEDLNSWHWNKIKNDIHLNLPWYSSMICVIRVSKFLLDKISIYAKTNNRLFMDEALFNTIAMHYKLNIINPEELKYITFSDTFDIETINENNLYHPIKDLSIHTKIHDKFYIDQFTNNTKPSYLYIIILIIIFLLIVGFFIIIINNKY